MYYKIRHNIFFQRPSRDPAPVPDGPDASLPRDGEVAGDQGAQRVRHGQEHVRQDRGNSHVSPNENNSGELSYFGEGGSDELGEILWNCPC